MMRWPGLCRELRVDPGKGRRPAHCLGVRKHSLEKAPIARTKFASANPILSVADVTRSVRYYVDVLGFSNAEWGGDDFTLVTREIGIGDVQAPR